MASSSRCDERVQINIPRLGKGKNIITRREDAIGRVPQKVILRAGGSPRDWSLGGDRRRFFGRKACTAGHYSWYMSGVVLGSAIAK